MTFEFISLSLELLAAFGLVGFTTFCFIKEMQHQNEVEAVVVRLKKISGI